MSINQQLLKQPKKEMSFKIESIPLESPDKWKNALKGIKHSFAHTWESCYAIYLTNRQRTYLFYYQNKDVRIVCPVSERTFDNYIDIVTPYGFSGFAGIGDCNDFPLHWNTFVKDRGYVTGYIVQNPIFENLSYLDQSDLYKNKTLYFLDLTQSDDQLFNNLSTNRKRQLKEWNDISSNIITDKSALSDFLLKNYKDFILSRNASSAYSFSDDTLSYLANSENVFLAGYKVNGNIEAVSLFGYTEYMGEFLFNVSLSEGKLHSAALIWYGIKYLKSLGVPMLNLGGGIKENDGVADFKKRFGSIEKVFYCLKQIYNRDIFEKLCKQVNADPYDMTSYFPPYRIIN